MDDEGLALNLITLALRNLRRRATRTIIVSLSVGLAVASALSLVALADSIKRSVGEGADERGADLTVLSRNASDIFSGFIAEDMKDKLSLIHGIQAVTGELVMYAPIVAVWIFADNRRHSFFSSKPVDGAPYIAGLDCPMRSRIALPGLPRRPGARLMLSMKAGPVGSRSNGKKYALM